MRKKCSYLLCCLNVNSVESSFDGRSNWNHSSVFCLTLFCRFASHLIKFYLRKKVIKNWWKMYAYLADSSVCTIVLASLHFKKLSHLSTTHQARHFDWLNNNLTLNGSLEDILKGQFRNTAWDYRYISNCNRRLPMERAWESIEQITNQPTTTNQHN